MTAQRILDAIDKSNRRQTALPDFRPGDSIKVWAKIREGEKTRLQAFEGVCIRRVSRGTKSTFTVRKISYGVGVERIFPDNSPNIDRVEIIARGRVHQAKLFYLRDLTGKAARIKEREGTGEAEGGSEGEGEGEGEAAAAAEGDEAATTGDKPKGRGKRGKKKKDSTATATTAGG